MFMCMFRLAREHILFTVNKSEPRRDISVLAWSYGVSLGSFASFSKVDACLGEILLKSQNLQIFCLQPFHSLKAFWGSNSLAALMEAEHTECAPCTLVHLFSGAPDGRAASFPDETKN